MVAVPFLRIPFTIIWACMEAGGRNKPSLSPPAKGNERKAKKSRFCPNWNLTGTLYHGFVILRSLVYYRTRPSAKQTDFSRFSYSPRIFWIRDILSENHSRPQCLRVWECARKLWETLRRCSQNLAIWASQRMLFDPTKTFCFFYIYFISRVLCCFGIRTAEIQLT